MRTIRCIKRETAKPTDGVHGELKISCDKSRDWSRDKSRDWNASENGGICWICAIIAGRNKLKSRVRNGARVGIGMVARLPSRLPKKLPNRLPKKLPNGLPNRFPIEGFCNLFPRGTCVTLFRL